MTALERVREACCDEAPLHFDVDEHARLVVGEVERKRSLAVERPDLFCLLGTRIADVRAKQAREQAA